MLRAENLPLKMKRTAPVSQEPPADQEILVPKGKIPRPRPVSSFYLRSFYYSYRSSCSSAECHSTLAPQCYRPGRVIPEISDQTPQAITGSGGQGVRGMPLLATSYSPLVYPCCPTGSRRPAQRTGGK